jgi:phosphopantothenoylcysteine decarboxylase/phosphopantothenate--cysteine ligase
MAHYIAKHSTGKSGYALAAVAVALGAETVLVSGPVSLPLPPGAQVMMAQTALDMLKICERELPCDIAIFAAEVSEWRLEESSGGHAMELADGRMGLKLVENPRIPRTIAARGDKRPAIIVGFTAETENVIENGRKKLDTECCDLIVAYDVSSSEIMSSDRNTVHIISRDGVETWTRVGEHEIARRLMEALAIKLIAH